MEIYKRSTLLSNRMVALNIHEYKLDLFILPLAYMYVEVDPCTHVKCNVVNLTSMLSIGVSRVGVRYL